MNELSLAASVLLARIDDTDYLAVRAVYAVTPHDPPSLYCLESEWSSTPMARIAALVERVAELESALAQQTRERAPIAPATDVQRKCPHCRKRPRLSNMQAHIAREHPEQRAVIAECVSPTLPSDLGWRCAAPGCTGAFTRDLHDPAHCTHHAAPRTNGAATVAS